MRKLPVMRFLRRLMANGWFIPMAYTAITLVVGMSFPRLEHHFLPELVSTMSASSAMAVCSSIASGMIALTGIVFSLTFLMVQFSATAYSPRLVLWIARDPVISHALGTFVATFLYALVMLAWVDRGASGKVPFISSWLVVVLVLASMAMFVALIERVALLQINRMLIFTGDQGRKSIGELYSRAKSAASAPAVGDSQRGPVTQTVVHSGRPALIQAIDMGTLVELASKAGAVIEVTVAVGDSIVQMTPMLRVSDAGQPLDENALRDAVTTGDERTFEQDPKYALRLIVDIAIKALSPAINDPTTAVQALDQIEDLLLHLGQARLDIGAFHDQQGKLRLIVPFPTWNDFLNLALGEIRYYGKDSVQVMRRMNALIKNLMVLLPVERRPALQHWDERLHASIKRTFEDAEERMAASVADRQGLGLDKAGANES
jgi:uncharacterized membrane protein